MPGGTSLRPNWEPPSPRPYDGRSLLRGSAADRPPIYPHSRHGRSIMVAGDRGLGRRLARRGGDCRIIRGIRFRPRRKINTLHFGIEAACTVSASLHGTSLNLVR